MTVQAPRRLAQVLGLLGALVLFAVPSASANQRAYFSDYSAGTTAIPGMNVAASGVLSPTGAPEGPAGAAGVNGVVITADASRLYAAGADGSIYGFSIAPASGALTPLPLSPYANGTPATGISVTPDGQFLYTGNGAGSISAFAIGANGALTELDSSPVLTPGSVPLGVAISSDGSDLYVADSNDFVLAYEIGADGALQQSVAPYPLDSSDPYAITLSPDGRFLYVPMRTSPEAVSGFSVAADGTLTELAGSPFPTGGANLFGGTVSPDSRFVYTTGYQSDDFNVDAIGADGALTPVAGSPFPTETTPAAPTTTVDGSHLIIAHGTLGIGATSYAIGAGGLPTEVGGSPFDTGVRGDFQSVALTPEQPPVAAFTVAQNGREVTLDAQGSTDAGGTIARYDWDFGDGTTLDDGPAQVTHTYAAGGSFSPSVTLTDDRGCSTTYVSAGQTAYCNGSEVATATATIETVPPGLDASAKKKQKLGKPIKVEVDCDEPCAVEASGSEKVKGEDGKDKLKLKPKAIALDGSEAETLKLKLSKKSARKAKKADKGKAKVNLVATDDSGNETTETVKVKLK